MTCCAHTFTRRQWMWDALVTSAGAALAACSAGRSGPAAATSAAPADAAAKLLRDTVSVDVHTHGGATGVTSKSGPGGDLARGMRAGRISVVDAMLRGGFTPADTAKIVGGNYLRIFAAAGG